MKLERSAAIFRRHMYATIHSAPAMIDWLFWPLVDVLVWGFLTSFIQRGPNGIPAPFGFLLAGVLPWDLLFRSKNGISLTFLDETWSRSVINVLVSPISPAEYLAGAIAWGLVRLATGWAITVTLAWILFSFSVFQLGPVLALFAAVLTLFGMALSMLVLGLVFRFGYGADILAWAIAFMVLPVSAVYYPVGVLPAWAQAVAVMFPTSHVFEAMRQVLSGGSIPWGHVATALGLVALYLIASFGFARAMFGALRRRGYVTRYM